MKKWIFAAVMLLLFTACGKEAAQTPVYEPYGLEIEYGDSGVQAMVHGYSWNAGDAAMNAMPGDPREMLTDIPFINETKDKKVKLLFAEEPDGMEIRCWSSADGYAEAVEQKASATITLPKDGASYLYEIHAVWKEDPKAPAWGDCYYYFRYLPANATGEQDRETVIFQVMQMEAADLFGVVMTNHLDGLEKTCTSTADKAAVLDYLQQHLVTSFVPAEAQELDYTLRMAGTDGTELTLGYGSDGKDTWLVINGQAYEGGVMDLYSLWKDLETEAAAQ